TTALLAIARAARSAPRYLPPCPTRRSSDLADGAHARRAAWCSRPAWVIIAPVAARFCVAASPAPSPVSAPHLPGIRRSEVPTSRSEEHTSELQSRENIVCRLLREKTKCLNS